MFFEYIYVDYIEDVLNDYCCLYGHYNETMMRAVLKDHIGNISIMPIQEGKDAKGTIFVPWEIILDDNNTKTKKRFQFERIDKHMAARYFETTTKTDTGFIGGDGI
jgi:hypothetical protein